ncbi:MAG: bifunctional glutamate N-acetyltransferase/amino-acid acetyltransferase ArgJ [Solirubrobacteraceae bacterium]
MTAETETFFSSRWAPRPEHVTELGGDALPAGFRAAGVPAQIKPSGAPDVALMVCDSPDATSAARFTASGTQAPPVLLCRERCRLDALRAVVVNAGNANAATGRPGFDNAVKMQGAGALAARVAEDQVAVCSTGVIGVPLPMDRVNRGIVAAAHALAPDGAGAFADAIETTDRLRKRARLRVTLPSGTVTLTAQAKGAGMISPRFATLLVFVQTDAQLEPATCDLLLSVCLKRSFARISVDGQLSTNDTVILQCSGESGVRVAGESEDELRFGEALDGLMRQLSLLVVRDGEGARRAGRVVVRGGDQGAVEAAARAVADSPLVKTALYGGDPNWGRIVQAVGAALPGTAPLALDIAIEGVPVCSRGACVPHDAAALQASVARDEVQYEIGLPGEGAETEVLFSDLGHEYVTLNGEYTT